MFTNLNYVPTTVCLTEAEGVSCLSNSVHYCKHYMHVIIRLQQISGREAFINTYNNIANLNNCEI